MSIPTPFNPLGTMGGRWKEVDMDSFQKTTWDDFAAMSPPGLVPCGIPLGDMPTGEGTYWRRCSRNDDEGLLFFGYSFKSTTYNVAYSYYDPSVPPRATKAGCTPALELWSLSEPRFFRVEFEVSQTPLAAYATTDDWGPGGNWQSVPIAETADGYVVEIPFRARSLIINTTRGHADRNSKKGITKIYQR